MELLSIIILIFYIYIMVCVLKVNEHLEMFLLTMILGLYFYIKNKNNMIEGYNLNNETYAPVGCSSGNCGDDLTSDHKQKQHKEKPQHKPRHNKPPREEPGSPHNKDAPSSMVANTGESETGMSNYDGIVLTTGNDPETWMKSPSNIPLNDNNGLYTIQGSTTPVKPVFSDPSSLTGPSLDGSDDTSNSLFMLSNNQVSPYCCPSTYSTSTGCVCSTEKQREFVKTRGHNA